MLSTHAYLRRSLVSRSVFYSWKRLYKHWWNNWQFPSFHHENFVTKLNKMFWETVWLSTALSISSDPEREYALLGRFWVPLAHLRCSTPGNPSTIVDLFVPRIVFVSGEWHSNLWPELRITFLQLEMNFPFTGELGEPMSSPFVSTTNNSKGIKGNYACQNK